METKLMSSKEPAVKPLGERGEIKVSNVIHGHLDYDKDSNIELKNISIFLKGIEEPIAIVEPEFTTDGAEFTHIIDSRARAGDYSAVWNTSVSNKETKVINEFAIKDDEIDRTLPPELQHLA